MALYKFAFNFNFKKLRTEMFRYF